MCAQELIVIHLVGMMGGKVPVRVTEQRFELTSQRQKVSRLPTELPGQNGRLGDMESSNCQNPKTIPAGFLSSGMF